MNKTVEEMNRLFKKVLEEYEDSETRCIYEYSCPAKREIKVLKKEIKKQKSDWNKLVNDLITELH